MSANVSVYEKVAVMQKLSTLRYFLTDTLLQPHRKRLYRLESAFLFEKVFSFAPSKNEPLLSNHKYSKCDSLWDTHLFLFPAHSIKRSQNQENNHKKDERHLNHHNSFDRMIFLRIA